MRIYTMVKLAGAHGEMMEPKALIDTGAEVSLLPEAIARKIGAWQTPNSIRVTGVHGDTRTFPIIAANVHFPGLNLIGGLVPLVLSDSSQETIIGMDILKPLGISIDARNNQLSVRNDIWEAFKTLAGIGVLIVGGVTLIDSLSEEEPPRGRKRY